MADCAELSILTEGECIDAATELGAIYVNSGDYPAPFGCISNLETDDIPRVWFNTNNNGVAQPHRRPICFTLSTTMPTTNPTANPTFNPTVNTKSFVLNFHD